jgi:hypothetical protein
VNELQSDTSNELSSALNQGLSNHSVQQTRCSNSLLASSDNTEFLPVRESGSCELRKGTFYGQSLLPSLSPPAPIDQSPGQMLLDKLGAPIEPGAEVGYPPSQVLLGACQMSSIIVAIKYADILYSVDCHLTSTGHRRNRPAASYFSIDDILFPHRIPPGRSVMHLLHSAEAFCHPRNARRFFFRERTTSSRK